MYIHAHVHVCTFLVPPDTCILQACYLGLDCETEFKCTCTYMYKKFTVMQDGKTVWIHVCIFYNGRIVTCKELMFVYIHVHVHIYMYVHTEFIIHYWSKDMGTCTYMLWYYMYVHVHTYIYTCIYVYMYMYIRTSRATYMYVKSKRNFAVRRTRMERENQDLALEQIRVKAAEYRTTVLESIRWSPWHHRIE